MFRKIGDFLIKEDETEFSIDYSLSLKDWIVFLMLFFGAVFFLILANGLLYSVDQKNNFKDFIAVGVVFALGLFLLFEGLSKVIRVKKNIIRIIKKENQLIYRNTLLSSKRYRLSDIEKFIFLEKEQQPFGTMNPIHRVYSIIIKLELKNRKAQYLFRVNTKNILWKKNKSLVRIEMGNIAENITKELNRNRKF
jgi:hypothetical protein